MIAKSSQFGFSTSIDLLPFTFHRVGMSKEGTKFIAIRTWESYFLRLSFYEFSLRLGSNQINESQEMNHEMIRTFPAPYWTQ
jgi:hypothetical protein